MSLKEQKNRCHYLSRLQSDVLLDIVKRQKPGFLSAGIFGKTRDNRITVYYRPEYRNSWNHIFYGEIFEHPNGTIITGHFRPSTGVKIFLWLWRSFVSILAIIILLAFFFSSESVSIFATLIPILMLLFSFLLEHIGTTLGKKSEANVIKFFEVELLATLFDNDYT